uniref:Uncharacterized protein n=1 Tax=Anguilla anguilla TaxID=7936 RepID=A0A0E9PGI6_ANGAN
MAEPCELMDWVKSDFKIMMCLFSSLLFFLCSLLIQWFRWATWYRPSKEPRIGCSPLYLLHSASTAIGSSHYEVHELQEAPV